YSGRDATKPPALMLSHASSPAIRTRTDTLPPLARYPWLIGRLRRTCERQASLFGRNLRSISRGMDAMIAAIVSLVPREQRESLDVMRVRKHVEDACRAQCEAVLLDERACVAGQRRGVTGHVDDAPHSARVELRDRPLGSCPRRIEHDDIPALAIEAPAGRHEVGGHEPRVLDAVAPGVAHGSRDEAGVTLDSEQRARTLRERQAEVTEPAVQIEHAVRRLNVGQADGSRH